MKNHIRHPLFPPLFTGLVSILGLCGIASYAWLRPQQTAAPPTDTATPLKYVLMATETETAAATEPPAATEAPVDAEDPSISSLPLDAGDIPTDVPTQASSQQLPTTNSVNTGACVRAPAEYLDSVNSLVAALDSDNQINSAWIVESNEVVQLQMIAGKISGPNIDPGATAPAVWGVFLYEDGSYDLYSINDTAQQYSFASWGTDFDPALTMETHGAQQAYDCAAKNP